MGVAALPSPCPPPCTNSLTLCCPTVSSHWHVQPLLLAPPLAIMESRKVAQRYQAGMIHSRIGLFTQADTGKAGGSGGDGGQGGG